MKSPVVIIGAGPAGLTAAYELTKLGAQSVIIEADQQVGGLSRTVNYRGYRFDIGGHRFFSKSPLVNAVWDEILGDEFLLRPRLSRIHYKGHFFDYPLKALNALTGLGPVESLLVGLSYVKAQLLPYPSEENFEQWVSNRFGRRLYRTPRRCGGCRARRFLDWAAQRIRNLSLGEVLRSALFKSRRATDGQVITTLIDSFRYPRLGPGMMWEGCRGSLLPVGRKPSTGSGSSVSAMPKAGCARLWVGTKPERPES